MNIRLEFSRILQECNGHGPVEMLCMFTSHVRRQDLIVDASGAGQASSVADFSILCKILYVIDENENRRR